MPLSNDKKKANGRAYYLRNREHKLAYQRAYRAAHPEERRAYEKAYDAARDQTVKRRQSYWQRKGLPLPTRAAPECCEICGRSDRKRRLALDHDHATGKFRGWLCGMCNTAIGKFNDNPVWLERAAVYVREGGLCAS